MPDSLADRLRGLLATDVYSERGRLRADDLLVRERVANRLGESAGHIRELIGAWRAERVPPSTREQPFPPAAVMEPIRRAERLARAIGDVTGVVRGLPVLSQDKVWDRTRQTILDELVQIDWTLVGEAERLAGDLAGAAALDEIDVPGAQEGVRRIRELVVERQRLMEIR